MTTEDTTTGLAAYEMRILNPEEISIFRSNGMVRLTLQDQCSWTRAQPMRAFPLSDPEHYIGFLDIANKDIGMVIDPSHLDHTSKQILDEELDRRYFVPIIRKIFSTREEYGTVTWDVETDRGRRNVIVRNLRDNIQELSSTRIIVTDVDGNRFEFPDISLADGKTQGLILRNL